jgi:hypothetical protein
VKAAVVGGGIFGCIIAVDLARAGAKVSLYEKRDNVLLGASRANQGRLHAGFHYPRSVATARDVAEAAPVFATRFPTTLRQARHYYLVAKDSRVNAEKYLAFCDEMQLSYWETTNPLVRRDSVDAVIATDMEAFIDFHRLRTALRVQLRACRIDMHLGAFVSPDILAKTFDWVIDATYGRHMAAGLTYELTEVALIRLGAHYAGQSFVVMDGPYCSLDPMPGTDMHMLYDVVHSVHYSSDEYMITPSYADAVDQGVQYVKATRVNSMERTAREFLRAIGMPEYCGSLYTMRAVPSDVDDTDERPTVVTRDGQIIRVLSGKICTSAVVGETVRQVIGA